MYVYLFVSVSRQVLESQRLSDGDDPYPPGNNYVVGKGSFYFMIRVQAEEEVWLVPSLHHLQMNTQNMDHSHL